MIISRIAQCKVCEDESITYSTVLPDGWLMTWEGSYIMCDKCIDRWKERFGEEPPYYIKGNEKELMLL